MTFSKSIYKLIFTTLPVVLLLIFSCENQAILDQEAASVSFRLQGAFYTSAWAKIGEETPAGATKERDCLSLWVYQEDVDDYCECVFENTEGVSDTAIQNLEGLVWSFERIN